MRFLLVVEIASLDPLARRLRMDEADSDTNRTSRVFFEQQRDAPSTKLQELRALHEENFIEEPGRRRER